MLEVLREVRAERADEVSETTLRMLAALEGQLGNWNEAAEALRMHVDKYGAQEGSAQAVQQSRTWLAYIMMRQGNNEEAQQLASQIEIDPASPNPDAAYVKAWAEFRARNYDKARELIGMAVRGWSNTATAPIIVEDMHRFYARTGASVEEAQALYAALAAKGADPAQAQYVWLFLLQDNLANIGSFERAIAALDAAIAVKEGQVPPNELLNAKFREANYHLRLNQPSETADALIEAHQIAATCAECDPNNVAAVVDSMGKIAIHFHTIYATTYDEAYYAPAKKLYDYYLAIQPAPANAGEIKTYAARLDETRQSAATAKGKHEVERMKERVDMRLLAVQACYESVLQANPELQGAVKVTLELDATGAVTGVNTEPAAGEDGMAAVAQCIAQDANTWTFPGRNVPGTTKVVLPLSFSPQPTSVSATAPAAGAQTAQ